MTALVQLRALPRPFWVLVAATFVNRFGLFVIPFLTVFVTRQGNTAAQAGWCLAAYSIGSFCAGGVGGFLSDRLSRKITLAIASFGGAICMMILSQTVTWQSLAIAAFFTGLLTDTAHAPLTALVQDLTTPEQRVTAFAVQRFAVNLGWSIGPAVAGWLAETSFFGLFIVDAVTSVVFGIVVLVALPHGNRTQRHLAGWGYAWQSIRRNRPFLALFFACICVSWFFRQSTTTYVLHFETSGHPLHWSGIILALNGLMICALEIPLTFLTTRFPIRRILALGYIGMASSYLILLADDSLRAFTLTMVVFTLGEMCAFSRQQAYAASLAPEDMRGRYSGFLGFAWSGGSILAGLLSLQLYHLSPAAVWITTAALGLIAATAILVWGREEPTTPL
ncbi:MAG: MFS transporter [Verrucomicrobiaceae bacterium]|nr:MFS transporter [Verrucomicrobiaceae bacterium]